MGETVYHILLPEGISKETVDWVKVEEISKKYWDEPPMDSIKDGFEEFFNGCVSDYDYSGAAICVLEELYKDYIISEIEERDGAVYLVDREKVKKILGMKVEIQDNDFPENDGRDNM